MITRIPTRRSFLTRAADAINERPWLLYVVAAALMIAANVRVEP